MDNKPYLPPYLRAHKGDAWFYLAIVVVSLCAGAFFLFEFVQMMNGIESYLTRGE
jgi:ABC-type lipoprotein release transport system permease subunit